MVAGRVIAVVFPQRAGLFRHIVEISAHVVEQLAVKSLTEQELEAQIVADESVGKIYLRMFVVLFTLRSEVRHERFPQLRVKLFRRDAGEKRVILARFRALSAQRRLAADVYRVVAEPFSGKRLLSYLFREPVRFV